MTDVYQPCSFCKELCNIRHFIWRGEEEKRRGEERRRRGEERRRREEENRRGEERREEGRGKERGEERREERRGRERRGEHEKDLLAQLFNTQPKTDVFNNPQPLTHPEN